jgi:uncharacterized protein (DUF2062 family)
MKPANPQWAARLRHGLASHGVWTCHPWLQRIASRLSDPKLWRLQHEAVARGVAIGTFWAFALPVAQLVVAAAHCTWWRANFAVAAAVSMVTNPLTIGFWLWLAYQLGTRVLGEPLLSDAPQDLGTAAWLTAYGWPLRWA